MGDFFIPIRNGKHCEETARLEEKMINLFRQAAKEKRQGELNQIFPVREFGYIQETCDNHAIPDESESDAT
jgi:hypothetical protein